MKLVDIEQFYRQVYEPINMCQRCALSTTATNRVIGLDGIRSKVWLMGEAPGVQEDLEGIPFVGRAGKCLNNILSEAKLKRGDFYVTNILKCRPPKNRPPTDFEIYECAHNLTKEMRILKPEIIITMGNSATTGLLYHNMTRNQAVPNISNARFLVYINRNDEQGMVAPTVVIPVYHPSYCMRNRMAATATLDDFKKIKTFIETRDIEVLKRNKRWMFD